MTTKYMYGIDFKLIEGIHYKILNHFQTYYSIIHGHRKHSTSKCVKIIKKVCLKRNSNYRLIQHMYVHVFTYILSLKSGVQTKGGVHRLNGLTKNYVCIYL